MDDKAHILDAYAQTISALFDVMLDGFTAAQGAADKEREAEQRFLAGLALGRRTRDRAIALVALRAR